MEGLDYLGCLLTSRNLPRLNDDLQEWIGEHEPRDGRFSSVIPDWTPDINPFATHGVVVLAPKSYFDFHATPCNGRPRDWWLLSDRFIPQNLVEPIVQLDFAVVDFDDGTAKWLDQHELPPQQPMPHIETASLPQSSSQDIIWLKEGQQIPVTRIRMGRKNTRVRLPDGTSQIIPNDQLHFRSGAG